MSQIGISTLSRLDIGSHLTLGRGNEIGLELVISDLNQNALTITNYKKHREN